MVTKGINELPLLQVVGVPCWGGSLRAAAARAAVVEVGS